MSKTISPVGLVSLAIAEGDTTPVPTAGAGAIVYSNLTNTPMVWNGSLWGALHHLYYGFKYSVTGTTIPDEKYPTTSEYSFLISQTNSSAKAGTAATDSTTFNIRKNGTTQIGTFTFAAGQSVATVSITNGAIQEGDYITIEAPSINDYTLADISFTIRA